MSAGDQKRGLVAGAEQAHLIEPVVVRDRSGWHRAWRLTRLGLLLLLTIAVAAAVALWIWRKPIADDVIRDELRARGVAATYTLDRVGFRTQKVSNLVIGDPADPDLTARQATIQLRLRLDGSAQVYRVQASGVRLKGRLLPNGKVSWGQIDKLLPEPSGKPFELPDLTVDLTDSTISFATPYGPMGFAVRGRGNLSGGFKGKLAATAPDLQFGACRLAGFRGLVDISVTARRPRVDGPVRAAGLNCPASQLRLVDPRLQIRSDFSEAFERFDGSGRLTTRLFEAGENGLANVIGDLSFKGRPADALGRVTLAAQASRLAQITAGRTRFDGRYRLNAERGRLTVVGDYNAGGVKLPNGLIALAADPLAGLEGSPVGPIAGALARAIRTAGSDFAIGGQLRLVNQPGGGGVRLETANVRSASGARVMVAGGDGINYYWPSGRIRLDGKVATRGGGLPDTRITLRQPRSGGGISGSAEIGPMAYAGSRLLLGTVRFAERANGWTELATVAMLDGPLPGGRIAGLRIPIRGRFGPGGALRFGEACIDTRFTALRAGPVRLGPTRFPLCPDGSALVSRNPGGDVRLAGFVRNPKLRGQIGSSPLAIDSTRLGFTSRAFNADNVRARLGRSDSPVLINLARLRGNIAGTGTGGSFAGADVIIGTVPVRLGEGEGQWRVSRGNLEIDGAAMVSSRSDPPDFYPLRSENLRFRLADNVIRTTGTLRHPASGTAVTDVTVIHELKSGQGHALLDVPGIRFGPGLQPEEITRLTEGVVALVNGRLSGQGRIDWKGSGDVASVGEFTVHDMDLAASFGPVTGLNGTIRFTDLLGLETAPGQTATVATINPGIPVENGVIRYQLLPDRLVKIERGEWPFMGGRLVLQETILNFGRPTPKRLTFEVIGLDARTFVESLGFEELSASGTFDGVLPMIFDDEGGRIVGGRLDSRPGGGTLAYNGVVNRASLGMTGRLAFDALRDLRFRSMIIRLDGYLDGEFATRMTIEGVGLGNTSTQRLIRAINRIPFKFNVSIKGPFRALIATAKSFRDPTQVIEPALPRPLDEIPGVVIETRRREESQEQSQQPAEPPAPVPTEQR